MNWLILRTASRNTLGLAGSLGDDGFCVWTPIKRHVLRVSAANAKRKTEEAILPGFIFAEASQIVDLLELAAMPVKPRRGANLMLPAHRSFSVFHYFDRIPIVREPQLKALRDLERPPCRKRYKPKDEAFAQNQSVRVLNGSFQGFVGVVEHCKGDKARVWLTLFGRHHKVDLEASCLELDQPLRRAA